MEHENCNKVATRYNHQSEMSVGVYFQLFDMFCTFTFNYAPLCMGSGLPAKWNLALNKWFFSLARSLVLEYKTVLVSS